MIQVLVVWFSSCVLVHRIGLQDLKQFFGEVYATPFVITIMAVSLIVFVVALINRRKDDIDFNYVLFSMYGLLIINLALIANIGVRVAKFSMPLCQRVHCCKNANVGMIMDPYKKIKNCSPQNNNDNRNDDLDSIVINGTIATTSAATSKVPDDNVNNENDNHFNCQDNESLLVNVHGSDNKDNDNDKDNETDNETDNHNDDAENKDENSNILNSKTVSTANTATSNNAKPVRRRPYIADSVDSSEYSAINH